jgi:GNAT superfamily N-acetyltransferase
VDDIAIRPARAKDLDRIVAIICDDPVPELRAIVPNVEHARRIGGLLARNRFQIGVRHTLIAEFGGEAIGLLERLRPGETSSGGAAGALRAFAGAARFARPQLLLRYVRYQQARASVNFIRPKDAYYISELDVHPNHRNRGAGGRLIAHAADEARAERFARMALTTTITNPAQHLYVRSGFRIVDVRRDAAYERITGIPGRVLMVRELG